MNITGNDPVAQTHKVMQNTKHLVEEAGGEMAHHVKIVVYITDVRHREAVYRTMGSYIILHQRRPSGIDGAGDAGLGAPRMAG